MQQELHGIEGTTAWPELVTQDYTVRGKFMHYLFRSDVPMTRSHRFSEAKIVAQMLAGRLTFPHRQLISFLSKAYQFLLEVTLARSSTGILEISLKSASTGNSPYESATDFDP